ncbi:MAG: NDP-sugar synthase [Gaiellaceae bacterium MAG52_C11]|nr:NDP-sugar synthase [Candidatus Gaiellasilicea maunaloa]
MSIPAVVLVGGLGTRLRPLTDVTRKDMLPLVDRPQLAYTFEHLRRFGVRKAIVSCGYLPTQIQEYFGNRYGELELEYRIEEEPLGTGGAIRFAADGIDGPFFALNGDSLRETDLDALVAFHGESGGRGTILLTPVEDPSRYGLVRLHDDGRVQSFLEKPKPEEIDTNLINAGLYVLEPDVLDLIPPGRAVSIEREVFPRLVDEGALSGICLPGYWLDIGTPDAYLQAHRDVLERNFVSDLGERLGGDYTLVEEGAHVDPAARLVPPVFVGAGAVVEAGARLGSLAVIGAGARIGAGVEIDSSVVAAGARIGAGTTVVGSIVGEQAEVGAGCQIRRLSVVGPGAKVGEGNMLDHGIRIAAGETIPPDALTFS